MRTEKLYSAIDVHVAGEAFRIIRDVPFIHYKDLKDLNDQLPTVFNKEISLLLNEPRGFAGMNGCLVVPPLKKEADVGAVFFDHQGTVPIQYGGIVALLTALLESGQLQVNASNEYVIETARGLVHATAIFENEQVVSVNIEGEQGTVLDKISTYTLIKASQKLALFNKENVDADIRLSDLSKLNKWGRTVFKQLDPTIDGVILVDKTSLGNGRIKTVTFRKDGWIVRSPGFEVTIACYSSLLASGSLPPDQSLVNESIFGSTLEAKASPKGKIRLIARAFITGMQTFVLDPTDPLADGFLLK